MDSRAVSVTRSIPASADAIFDVLADPRLHPVIDGSGTVRTPRGEPERLGPGARFGMDMRIGVPYRIVNRVVEFDEGRRIAWRHWGGHTWRYELEPIEGGTDVTETFDWSTSIFPWFIERIGYPSRHLPAMRSTLERLERLTTTGTPDEEHTRRTKGRAAGGTEDDRRCEAAGRAAVAGHRR